MHRVAFIFFLLIVVPKSECRADVIFDIQASTNTVAAGGSADLLTILTVNNTSSGGTPGVQGSLARAFDAQLVVKSVSGGNITASDITFTGPVQPGSPFWTALDASVGGSTANAGRDEGMGNGIALAATNNFFQTSVSAAAGKFGNVEFGYNEALTGVFNDGLGEFTTKSFGSTVTINFVPEPSGTLLILGLGSFLATARRRRD